MPDDHNTFRSTADATLGDRLHQALDRAVDWSIARQKDDGHWVGHLETNSCMEAEWVLALHILGLRDHPIIPGLLTSLLKQQRDDGSWGIYHDAPAGDINTTVEAYAALRAMGHSADEPALKAASDWIAAKGGLAGIRVFTRYWLALIGEYPWDKTPNIPPEVVYLPRWLPVFGAFNIYNFASWARATLMAIAILSARRIVVPLPAENRLDALFPDGRARFNYGYPNPPAWWVPLSDKVPLPVMPWRRFFLCADWALHRLQSLGQTWVMRKSVGLGLGYFRRLARAWTLEWITRHQDADGVWGGIQPPWIYSLMALYHEGYPLTHPVMAKGLGALDDPRWTYRRDDGATFVQACVSPVWDTVLTLLALQDTDADAEAAHWPHVEKAVRWVLSKEVRTRGDWSVKLPDTAPGGWAFEYENASFPDLDDTAVALIVLAKYRDDPRLGDTDIAGAIDRAIAWVFAMQCRDGGWGAFDKDNDRLIITKIPFCDFGEALDPPSVDVTAHVLEALAANGYGDDDPRVAKALAWMMAEQEGDGAAAGSWWGRWGVNYIYGTGAALPAIRALNQDMRDPAVLKAADWLVAKQNADGGWGETCGSYMDPDLAGSGASTASQTGFALMGLLATARPEDRPAIERGLAFLADRQTADGTWDEPEYTGTGFPGYGFGLRIDLTRQDLDQDLAQSTELSRGFMINYNLYRHYFPLMAMGRARDYLGRLANA